MRLLEVVRGAKTAKPMIATAMQLARKIGKVGVLVGVCHGFVGNRMLHQRQREAQKLVLEGAMPWNVDRVIYDFGLPMGPFAMSDLAGLDIGWSKATSKSSTIREILCEMDRRVYSEINGEVRIRADFLPCGGSLSAFLLYPQKQTFVSAIAISALCQKQTHAVQQKILFLGGRPPSAELVAL